MSSNQPDRDSLASRTRVDDPDEPTIVVPRPSSGQPDAPVEVKEPAAVEEPVIPGEAEGPPGGQQAGAIPREPPDFLPRAELLAELDRPGARVLVLHSATGAGATQLAAAYARARAAAGWRVVAWVSAADPGTLLGGLAAVADTLGLSEPAITQDRADPGHLVRRWLETDGDRCLLVLDVVTDPRGGAGVGPGRGRRPGGDHQPSGIRPGATRPGRCVLRGGGTGFPTEHAELAGTWPPPTGTAAASPRPSGCSSRPSRHGSGSWVATIRTPSPTRKLLVPGGEDAGQAED